MKIEKNIPIPTRHDHGKYKEVLLKMEVGDSVVTDFNGQAGFRQAARKLGYKVGARKLGRGYEQQSNFRVWRLK